jgi:adenosine deaminase/aminodeoxyfutalosine deaminase
MTIPTHEPGEDALADWIRRLPKAELHLHLEGTITPETWRRILLRHAAATTPTVAELAARYRFTDIAGFFDVFIAVTQSLRAPEDYHLAALEAGRALARQNVRYAEFHTSVAAAQWVGRLSGDDVIPALAAGLAEAEREGGPAWRLIVDVVRDFCARGCGEIALDLALRHRKYGVVALGMGGGETLPAEVARDVFAQARASGLRLTAHAGEQAGPASIWAALEIGAERIGHAARAPEDPALVDHLATAHTPLEMCLTSNVRTGAVASLEAHPLGDFLRRGMNVSLSTDDPPFFGSDLCAEYRQAARVFGLSRPELTRLARNAYEAAFLPLDSKAALLEEFDASTRDTPSVV